MNKHIKPFPNGMQCECTICGKQLESKSALLNHAQGVHGIVSCLPLPVLGLPLPTVDYRKISHPDEGAELTDFMCGATCTHPSIMYVFSYFSIVVFNKDNRSTCCVIEKALNVLY